MLRLALLATLAKTMWPLPSYSPEQLNELYKENRMRFRHTAYIEEKSGIELLFVAADVALLAAWLQMNQNKTIANYYDVEIGDLEKVGISKADVEVIALLKVILSSKGIAEEEHLTQVLQAFSSLPHLPGKRRRGRRSQQQEEETTVVVIKKHTSIEAPLWTSIAQKLEVLQNDVNDTEVISLGLFMVLLFYQ